MQNDQVFIKMFSKRLKRLREEKEWSQGQLAKKIDVESQVISKYERGISCPPAKIMVRIAMAFNVSLDYLMTETKENQGDPINNPALQKRIAKLNELSEDDQSILISVMDAFFKKHRFEEASQLSF